MMIIDKERIKARFFKSQETYNEHAIVQSRVCKTLVENLQSLYISHWDSLLEIGCGSGLLTNEVMRRMPPTYYFLNDLVPLSTTGISQIFDDIGFTHWEFLEGDAEAIDFPTSLDGIISTSAIQWFENLPNFIEKAWKILSSSGIFAFSTFGPENFREIKVSTNKGLKYYSLAEIKDLLNDRFELLFVQQSFEQLHFESAIDVLRHIKDTGVNGTASSGWCRTQLHEFEINFPKNDQGKVVLTYHPILIIAKKRI